MVQNSNHLQKIRSKHKIVADYQLWKIEKPLLNPFFLKSGIFSVESVIVLVSILLTKHVPLRRAARFLNVSRPIGFDEGLIQQNQLSM